MNQAAGRISGADITVPSGVAITLQAPPAAKLDIDLILHRIRQMLDGCATSNRNELLVIAIEALIEEGVNTGPSIIGAARSLGFKSSHAGAILGKSEGRRWRLGADGVHRLIAGA